MFTTWSTSGNTNRCGVSASRSFGPMSGSVLISWNARSMTSRNSFGDSKALLAIPLRASLYERRAALDEVLVDGLLDRVAHALGELEHERAVVGGVRRVAGSVDRVAELEPPLRRQRHRAKWAEQRERRRDRDERRAGELGQPRKLAHLRVDLLAAHDGDRDDRRSRAQRQLHEPAAAEALQPVAVLEVLARPL